MSKIIVMAGGTGGHIFPALSVAKALHSAGCEIVWLGSRGGMEERLVPSAGFDGEWISITGLRGTGLRNKLLAPVRLMVSIVQALKVLIKHKPAVVLGMGGFASGPGGLAAWLLRRPLVIHEQNAVAGTTNRILARFARQVFCAFPQSFKTTVNAQIVGNPVRSDIVALPMPDKRWQQRSGPMRILVLGGSQGALALNQYVPGELIELAKNLPITVRHQTGRHGQMVCQEAYNDASFTVSVEKFIDDMAAAYAWADIAICRAGALTISELSMAGLGAVLVPFPHAIDDHQTANANFLVEIGAAKLLAQAQFQKGNLTKLLTELRSQPDRLQAMACAARKIAQPKAADQVALRCLQLAAEHAHE